MAMTRSRHRLPSEAVLSLRELPQRAESCLDQALLLQPCSSRNLSCSAQPAADHINLGRPTSPLPRIQRQRYISTRRRRLHPSIPLPSAVPLPSTPGWLKNERSERLSWPSPSVRPAARPCIVHLHNSSMHCSSPRHHHRYRLSSPPCIWFRMNPYPRPNPHRRRRPSSSSCRCDGASARDRCERPALDTLQQRIGRGRWRDPGGGGRMRRGRWRDPGDEVLSPWREPGDEVLSHTGEGVLLDGRCSRRGGGVWGRRR